MIVEQDFLDGFEDFVQSQVPIPKNHANGKLDLDLNNNTEEAYFPGFESENPIQILDKKQVKTRRRPQIKSLFCNTKLDLKLTKEEYFEAIKNNAQVIFNCDMSGKKAKRQMLANIIILFHAYSLEDILEMIKVSMENPTYKKVVEVFVLEIFPNLKGKPLNKIIRTIVNFKDVPLEKIPNLFKKYDLNILSNITEMNKILNPNSSLTVQPNEDEQGSNDQIECCDSSTEELSSVREDDGECLSSGEIICEDNNETGKIGVLTQNVLDEYFSKTLHESNRTSKLIYNINGFYQYAIVGEYGDKFMKFLENKKMVSKRLFDDGTGGTTG